MSGRTVSARTQENLPTFDDMTFIYKFFLRLLGILPFEGRDFTYFGSRLLIAYGLIWSSIYWSMVLFYVINLRKLPSVGLICETVSMTVGVLRYYILIPHRSEFADALEESREIWQVCDEDGRRSVLQFERKIRLVFKVLIISWSVANFFYCISAAFSTITATDINGTRPEYLPFKWYSDEAPKRWPGYKIIFVTQALIEQNACVMTAVVDSAAPLLIMIAAGFFRALQRRILRISENADESSSVEVELMACVRLHQRILELCTRIERITRTLFLVQVLSTGYNLSLIGLKIIGSDPDRYKYVPFILGMLGQLFICQWAPDHLVNESSAISTAAYSASITWMRSRLGKLLVLVIVRSQRPVQITASGIVYLSLENFGSMLASAVSFLTVLRNFDLKF